MSWANPGDSATPIGTAARAMSSPKDGAASSRRNASPPGILLSSPATAGTLAASSLAGGEETLAAVVEDKTIPPLLRRLLAAAEAVGGAGHTIQGILIIRTRIKGPLLSTTNYQNLLMQMQTHVSCNCSHTFPSVCPEIRVIFGVRFFYTPWLCVVSTSLEPAHQTCAQISSCTEANNRREWEWQWEFQDAEVVWGEPGMPGGGIRPVDASGFADV
ncbi:UNVERIFIED_CONTAM: hypothetical protein Sradi_5891200 [Sesamum radiatum]|uniref:Uncharacterized protein n=1 Tax=Sesamum radiatum TaxID=300843 RepID=A0AAW2KT28_SESRA